MMFKSSRTKSLGAAHPVDAWLVDTQGAVVVSLKAGRSQGEGESSIVFEALLPIEARVRNKLPLQGWAYDEGVGSGRDRASILKNCADWENAGEQQRVTTKRIATA
jgi:hypothetical protein